MAMIQCPECNQEISDKAKKCIHCGKVFVEEVEAILEIKCMECGAVLSETDESCPKCGCPVEKKEADREKTTLIKGASFQITQKTKKTIIGVVIAILVCIVAVIGFGINSKQGYIDNLRAVQALMLDGGGEAEDLCILTLKVWGNSIYEERDSETDKYTKPDGYFLSDFNDALNNLYTDPIIMDQISTIEKNQTVVKDLMKKLQDPPEELSKCYDTVLDLYAVYQRLTDLAISPSGNYRGFSDSKNNAVSDFMLAFDKLDNQIPEGN